MGARLLGQSLARLPVDFRLLGRRQGDRGELLVGAACDSRSRPQRGRAFGGHDMAARLLDVEPGPLCLAPGYWATVQPDWDWVPAHYVYAPRGYVFVDGYWDYSIRRRGVLFAPVYFTAGVYAQPGFSYSPTTVINPDVFTNCLFVRPQCQHYYFGDYYAANYEAGGFYPSYSYNSNHYGYDPIYAHDRWLHRQDGQWERRVAADFQNRRDHEDARPPRTWAAQREIDARAGQSRERGIVMAAPLNDLSRSKDSPLRFQPVGQSERRQFSQHAQEMQRFGQQRQSLESNTGGVRPDRGQGSRAASVRLPGSPIVARPAAELDRNHVPPQAHAAPKPDLNVAAKPRMTRFPGQPQQGVTRPQPQGQAPAERAAPQRQAPAERASPQRQAPAERAAPQRQAPVERAAPHRQAPVERAAPEPRGNSPAGAKQDQRKSENKN